MALTRIYGRVVQPHGTDDTHPVTGSGVIEYVHTDAGTIDGAVHGPDRLRVTYTDGIAADAYLKPGMWRGYVYPDAGRTYSLALGIPDDGQVTIADAVGVTVPGGIVTKGDPGEKGDTGASVVGARDNGDQTVTFLLSDGTETAPVEIPAGPQGVQGPAGVDGADGVQGPKGDPGEPGPKGDKGDTGATGAKGEKGDTGAKGADGTAVLPDTGWRKIDLPTGYATATGHGLYVRRTGNTVRAYYAGQATTAGSNVLLWTMTNGFKPTTAWPVVNAPAASGILTDSNGSPTSSAQRALVAMNTGVVNLFNTDAGSARFASISWVSDETFPTALPGNPA